jgi:S-DNA-T family DNA segregation ATPase FtsK/SpoIIIE
VARGRAAGIVVVAATQKPAADIVPTSIRDLFGCRLAFRCSTRDASDTVLGAGWATEGYSASEIDPAQRGVGYLLAEGTLPLRMRCFILEDAPLFDVAARAERLRGTAQ